MSQAQVSKKEMIAKLKNTLKLKERFLKLKDRFKLKNFMPSRDYRVAAAVGAVITLASLTAAVAISAFIGIGNSVVMPVLLTLGASAVALEISFKFAYADNFKIGTCLASAAATAGGLALAFNTLYKAPEQPPAAPRFQTTVLKQEFDKSAVRKTIDAASTYRITRPGTPAIAFPSGG
ncbi:MAG: hypothetical protein K8R48_02235 [Alphaproteobacteria bacterium]|nr:hypothetical protein [Alphaproteobacteria bacterium]